MCPGPRCERGVRRALLKSNRRAADTGCVSRLPLLLSLLVLGAVGAGCGATGSAGVTNGPSSSFSSPAPQSSVTSTHAASYQPPLADARAVVKAYVAAYTRHDPTAICGLQSAALRRFEVDLLHHVFTTETATCAQVETLQFSPGVQDSPPPLFRRATVVRWEGSRYDGSLAAIAAAIHVEFPDGVKPLNDPQTAVFFLADENGKWRILDEGGLPQIVAAGGEVPFTVGMTPLRPSDVGSSLAVTDAGFTCDGTASVSADPPNDVHDLLRVTETSVGPTIAAPWVDIRHVAVYGTPSAHPCIDVTFAKPLRAGTTVDVILGGDTAAQLVLGKAPQAAWEGLAPSHRPFGEHDTTLRLLLAPNSDVQAWSEGHLAICAEQPLYNQPLLNDIRGPQDIWGYHAKRPLADCP